MHCGCFVLYITSSVEGFAKSVEHSGRVRFDSAALRVQRGAAVDDRQHVQDGSCHERKEQRQEKPATLRREVIQTASLRNPIPIKFVCLYMYLYWCSFFNKVWSLHDLQASADGGRAGVCERH